MSYRPLIIRSEFLAYVKLGANVAKENEIETFIKDMQEVEFETIVPEDFYADITGTITSRPELSDFLETFVKPYLISGSYEKFLLWHGRSVSQYGLREDREDTSDPISDKARGEIMADIRKRTNVYLSKMNRQLLLINYTLDGVAYNFFNDYNHKRPKSNIGIKQAGRRNINQERNRDNFNNHGYDY